MRKFLKNTHAKGTIGRFVELFLALSLLGPLFGFIVVVLNDNNTAQIAGASVIVPLIGIFVCLGLVYDAVKHIKT